MKFLFKYNVVIVHIGRIAMVPKVVLDHLVGDVPCTPYTISNGPKVVAPIFLAKGREPLLKTARCPCLEALYKVAYFLRGTVLDMYVHVVLAYHAFKDTHILGITDLLDKVSAPDLDIALENMETIFGDPNYMRRQPRYRMTGLSLLFSHITNIEKCVATESLALK